MSSSFRVTSSNVFGEDLFKMQINMQITNKYNRAVKFLLCVIYAYE